MSVSSLKDSLKKAGMSQNGDKGTLEHRLSLHETCLRLGLQVNGMSPCAMKLGELKKAASAVGVSPIGSQDEILDAFIKYLASKTSNKRDAGSDDRDGSKEEKSRDGVSIAKKVLELAEQEDYEAILNLGIASGTPQITRTSSVAIMRKAYLKLSLVIHPDKLGKSFSEATKAFQALVRSFEYLSTAEELGQQSRDDTSTGMKNGTKMVARSNEGCYRTTVCCPRCKQPWSEGTLDGNPDYFYNFLMTGLKQFTCSTCLFEFGCVTAVHKCPLCRGRFEYAPQDYHRKITCGNKKCSQEFGFYMYHVSERFLKNLKQDIREELERRKKSRESKMRRANGRRGREEVDEEAAFVLGLVDVCPRCGLQLDEFVDDEEARRHLMDCADGEAHRDHSKKKEEKKRKAIATEERLAKQEDAQALAAWEMLGAESTQLYLLSETQLKALASDRGLAVEGTRDQLISTIVRSGERTGRLQIENKGTGSALVVSTSSKRRKIKPGSVPSNLGGLSIGDLKAICASHGISFSTDAHKADLVNLIEDDLFGNDVIVID